MYPKVKKCLINSQYKIKLHFANNFKINSLKKLRIDTIDGICK